MDDRVIPHRNPENVDRFDHKGFALNALLMSFFQAWFCLAGQAGIVLALLAGFALVSILCFLRLSRRDGSAVLA